MKRLVIRIHNCRQCPFLRFFGDSGCRHYTPAHYSCGYFQMIRQPLKLIANIDEKWDGEIPEWCPMEDYKDTSHTVCGFTDWER